MILNVSPLIEVWVGLTLPLLVLLSCINLLPSLMALLNFILMTLGLRTIALLIGSIAVTLGVVFDAVTLLADTVFTFKKIANPNNNSTANNNLFLIYTPPI